MAVTAKCYSHGYFEAYAHRGSVKDALRRSAKRRRPPLTPPRCANAQSGTPKADITHSKYKRASHVKRTGTALRSLQKGEKLPDKIEEQVAVLQKLPLLARSFFKAPSVAYIGDC